MPETVTLRVLMHCEGCANTVKRACARIPGVAKYTVNYPAQKVTVTGDINCDQVLKRILKTGKHAELEPEQPKKQEVKKEQIEKEESKEEKKQEEPKARVKIEEKKQVKPPKGDPYPAMAEVQTMAVQTVILKVVLHCEGCARAVKKAIKRIPGVTAYDVDFPGQKVTVIGMVTPEDVYRYVSRTGKITVLVPPPPPPPPPAPPPDEPVKVEEPPKEEPPKEEPKAEEAKPEKPKEEATPAAQENKEEPPKEESKPEEPKKEDEAKKEEATPPIEEKQKEDKKPEEAQPEQQKEGAAAPAAEENKEEAKPEPPPPPAAAPAPAPTPPPPTLEELYPVTFVLGPDYTRYYYY